MRWAGNLDSSPPLQFIGERKAGRGSVRQIDDVEGTELKGMLRDEAEDKERLTIDRIRRPTFVPGKCPGFLGGKQAKRRREKTLLFVYVKL